MPLNNNAMQVAANALRAVMLYGQLHSAAAGTLFTSNVTTAARQPVTWTATSGLGNFGLASAVAFTGGGASNPIYSVTFWSASTAGTCYGEFPVTGGDAAFDATGNYSLTASDLNGTVA